MCRPCLMDGESALNAIMTEKPDSAFVNTSIAKLSGIEVCRQSQGAAQHGFMLLLCC